MSRALFCFSPVAAVTFLTGSLSFGFELSEAIAVAEENKQISTGIAQNLSREGRS